MRPGHRNHRWALFVAITAIPVPVPAQTADTLRLPPAVPPPIVSGAPIDSAASHGQDKSPGTAMLLSAVLPGAGQFYNESYWKVPVIAGLGTYFVVEFIDNNKKYNDYSDQYEESLGTTPGGDSQILSYREFYRDQRDTFAWYFLILYGLNILDAYVDASLFEFDVGGDLAGGAGGPAAPGMSVRLSVRF
jgi:hypothetical protein